MDHTPAPLPVYLIDDDASFRQSVGNALGLHGYTVRQFENAQAFLDDRGATAPGVVLTDMRMPGLSGVHLQERLAQAGRAFPVVFMSGESRPEEIILALKNGAFEFLLKPFNLDDLLGVVGAASAQAAQRQADQRHQARIGALLARLTARERQVCELMLQGLGNKEIANVHGVTAATVKLHRRRVLDKMEVRTLSGLVSLLGPLPPAAPSPRPPG